MPTVWITYAVMMCCDVLRERSGEIEWYNIIYPTRFWFINSILFYFLLIYFISKKNKQKLSKKHLKMLSITSIIINIIWYELFANHDKIVMDEGGIKCWFYFFSFFIWGYYVKSYCDLVKPNNWGWFNAIMSVILFYAYKKSVDFFPCLIDLQAIAIPVLMVYVIFSYRQLAKMLMKYNPPLWTRQIVIFLSSHTLEIYVVQVYFIKWLMPLMPFPWSIVVLLMLIMILSWAIQCITERLPIKKIILYEKH